MAVSSRALPSRSSPRISAGQARSSGVARHARLFGRGVHGVQVNPLVRGAALLSDTSANVRHVTAARACSKTGCGRPAVATLTYVYSDSTAVLGPLATYAEPHCYDLCADHAGRLTAPRGWEVVRLDSEPIDPRNGYGQPDDLDALARAVHEPAGDGPRQLRNGRHPAGSRLPDRSTDAEPARPGRRGHLRVVPDQA